MTQYAAVCSILDWLWNLKGKPDDERLALTDTFQACILARSLGITGFSMQNTFGQDIQAGDYVGLGIRQDNGSEQRVGRVLRFVEAASRGSAEWKARCIWFDADRAEDGFVFESQQKFAGIFKLDPESLDRRIRRALEVGYNVRNAG